MQRLRTPSSSSHNHHTTKSMSVSQSPDSVAAEDNNDACPSAAEDGVAAAAATDGGIQIQSRALQTAAARVSFSPLSAPPLSHQSTQSKSKNTVINPYAKENRRRSTAVDTPPLTKKQQFVENYRLQALQHSKRKRADARSISTGGGPASASAVSSVSALSLLRTTQQWRSSWQQNMSCSNTQSELNDMPPLRPRLFLFRRRHGRRSGQQLPMVSQTQNHPNGGENRIERPMTHQQQQQRNEGIWELGTGITELSGEGGSGKTQICLSLCVTCAMTPLLFPHPSNGNGSNTASTVTQSQGAPINHYTAIYITMGEGIPSVIIARRLEQMVRARLKRDDPNEVTQTLSRIGLLSIRNEEEFVEFVEQDLPLLLESHNNTHPSHGRPNHHHHHHAQLTKIGLVAFDGIAGFFRFSDPLFQHSRNSMFHIQRSSKFLQVSSQLRKLSNVYDVPILITNQVTASIPPEVGSGGGSEASLLASTSGKVVPALGLAWSNCVTTRYILQRKDGVGATVYYEDGSDQNMLKDDSEEKNRKQSTKVIRARKARVLQSVNMPEEREVWFVIDTGEVVAM